MLNPAPLIHPIISGDVRGGDLHGERAVQERGSRSLQQKPRLSEPFPGGNVFKFSKLVLRKR